MADFLSTPLPTPSERFETHLNGGPPAYRPFTVPDSRAYLPGGYKSLSGISIRGFGLGFACGLSVSLTIGLAYLQNELWRAPFFIATLSLFHYLEFDMTARFNPHDAKVASYLLTSNGSAYNIAHTMALTELLLRSWLKTSRKPAWVQLPFKIPALLPTVQHWIPVSLGFVMILCGQYARSAAMARAGKSFNHLVQSTKKDDHVLVTTGIYAFSRHPSYMGFFWWGIGTQLVMGNHICLPAYAFVLWTFFASRIRSRSPICLVFHCPNRW